MSVDGAVSNFNPLVAAILRSPFHWFLSFGLMLITVTGRRSGRRYTIPVGYQRHGEVLTVLVSEAAKKQWWRNFEAPAAVELRLKGRQRTGTAQVTAPDSAEFHARTQETLTRLPWMAKVFGIALPRGGQLSADQVALLGQTIAMVQVALNPEKGV